jgi:hypothetical protein
MKKIFFVIYVLAASVTLMAQNLGWNGNININGATTRTIIEIFT